MNSLQHSVEISVGFHHAQLDISIHCPHRQDDRRKGAKVGREMGSRSGQTLLLWNMEASGTGVLCGKIGDYGKPDGPDRYTSQTSEG